MKGDFTMKTMTRILAFALLAVMVLSLVACSSFGSIKKNFEKAGYTYIENADSEDGDAAVARTITAELEEGDVSCTAHLFKTTTTLVLVEVPVYALVLEFATDEDMTKALSESETLKGMLKDAQDSDYVNGNCVLVPLSITKFQEMITIFKGE